MKWTKEKKYNNKFIKWNSTHWNVVDLHKKKNKIT